MLQKENVSNGESDYLLRVRNDRLATSPGELEKMHDQKEIAEACGDCVQEAPFPCISSLSFSRQLMSY